jgi:mannopine transport system substrate-binding protein
VVNKRSDTVAELADEVSERLTRRSMLRGAAALAVSAGAVPLIGCGSSSGGGSSGGGGGGGSLTFSSLGGDYSRAYKDAFVEAFTKQTGTTVRFDDAPGQIYARLLAQNKSGNITWDVVEIGVDDFVGLSSQGYLMKLPADVKAKLAARSLAGSVSDYGVANGAGANNVIVSSNPHVKKPPLDPAQFFDVTNYPGVRGMWGDGYFDNPVMALYALGVPQDKLFPLDLDRAYQKLDDIRPHVKTWWTTGDQSQQLIRDNEVDINLMWDGRATGLKFDDKLDVNLSYQKSTVYGNTLVIPRGAPHPEPAERFLEFMAADPKGAAQWTAAVGYPSSAKDADKYLPQSQKVRLWTYPAIRRQVWVVDWGVVSKQVDLPKLKDRWYKWLHS